MKNVCKEYISDAKRFFPITGKDERRYLRKMAGVIQDACDTKNITTKEQLYTEYAQPYQIANNYYESVKTETIIKKIKISKYIKTLITILIVVLLVFATVHFVNFNLTRDAFIKEELVDYAKTVETVNDKSEHNAVKSDNFDDFEDEIIE